MIRLLFIAIFLLNYCISWSIDELSHDVLLEEWVVEQRSELTGSPTLLYIETAYAFFNSDQIDSTIHYLTIALHNLKGSKFEDQVISLNRLLGQFYIDELQDQKLARSHLLAAIQQLSPKKQPKAYLSTLDRLTWCYYWSFELKSTTENSLEGLSLAEQHNELFYEVLFTQWLGKVFVLQKNWDEVFKYYERTLQLAKELNHTTSLYGANLNLAVTYFKSGQVAEALPYLEASEVHLNKMSDKSSWENDFLIWKGTILGANKQYEASELIVKDLISRFDSLGHINKQLHMRLELGRIYLEQKKNWNCIKTVNEVFVLAPERTTLLDKKFGYSLLRYAYENVGDYRKAMESLVALNKVDAQLDSVNNQKTIQELEEQYRMEKQEQIIKEQSITISKQNWLATALSLAVLFLGATFFMLYFIQKSKNKLAKQHQIIDHQAKKLRQLDQAKSRFFANVSHELRTPLTLILSPINKLLKNPQLTNKQTKLLKIANRNGQQLQELVNQILALRKLESGKLTIHTEPTVLSTFFLTYFSQFESLAESKEIEYLFDIEIEQTTAGYIDIEKCRQLLYNLLSNAFKFTPNGGQIKVNANLHNTTLELSVSNTGEGIHPDDLPYIFDRYFQTDRPDKPSTGGTGIGLALCKEYTQLFGGTITVESQLNESTTFIITFPIMLADAAETATVHKTVESVLNPTPLALENKVASTQPKANILVVEDNPDLAKYLKIILTEKYNITLAEHGQKAWDYLLSNKEPTAKPVDLILSDLMMPVMDGYQLLEKLKSHDATRHIPVVMLTARAELQDRLKALRIGVDDYLTKPFEEEELMVRIKNLLQHQKARSSNTTKNEKNIPAISKEDQEWLIRFEEFVEHNLSNDLLSLSLLSDEFAMSEPTLFRQTKRLIGLSPVQYVKEVRLAKALRLLENHTYNSVSKVAYEIGYADANSFRRAFKKRFGKSPSNIINA